MTENETALFAKDDLCRLKGSEARETLSVDDAVAILANSEEIRVIRPRSASKALNFSAPAHRAKYSAPWPVGTAPVLCRGACC